MNHIAILAGQKFNTLRVIREAPIEFKVRKRTTWECLCDCGKTIYLISKFIKKSKSCSLSCIYNPAAQLDLTGNKFGRLVVLSEEKGSNKKKNSRTWKCQCDCGNIAFIVTSYLTTGDTKSCGCGEKENRIKNVKLGRKTQSARRPDPILQVAKYIYRLHYDDGDLLFEDFLELSQKNCHYCGAGPSNKLNFRWTEEYANASIFIYNGLDRKYSNIGHIKSNVVTCCKICNSAKLNQSYESFINIFERNHFQTLKCREIVKIPEPATVENYLLNKNILKIGLGARIVLSKIGLALEKRFYGRKSISSKYGYNDGDLSLRQFLYLICHPCYYCGRENSNRAKWIDKYQQTQYFLWNGLDRMCSDQKHLLENCVPCCLYCNYAKQRRSAQEFINWLDKGYYNLKDHGIFDIVDRNILDSRPMRNIINTV